MALDYKPTYIDIESVKVAFFEYNGKTLYCFSDLGQAFNISTRDRPIQHQMKAYEKVNLVNSFSLKGKRKNMRMLPFALFREIITNAIPEEIQGGFYSEEKAKETLELISTYMEKFGE